ncbi:MAG: PrsW family glutamic-type intramembrane protease [Thermotogota bacterium]
MRGRLLLASTLTAFPILVLVGCFVRREARRKSLNILIGTFLLGLAAALPAMAVVLLASWMSFHSPWLAAGIAAFAVTAVPEEFLKFLVIRGYSARRTSFRDETDGFIYGITAALGFGALENALYVVQGGWATATLRAVTAVPMNAATGAILGYSAALACTAPARRGPALWGLCAAVLLHGVYDFSLIATALAAEESTPKAGSVVFPAVACVVLVGSVGWVLYTARRLRRGQMPPTIAPRPPSEN